ncbi:MAG TPA: serine/threonine-protein kinase [Polyangiales bacterium]|nr:serine/threonine-protein kinase [Polyangiales bacterium]
MTGGVFVKAQQDSSLPSNERYEVHALLGRGGMALVYEATDSVTSQRVALKRLQTLPEPAKQQRNAELFEREFHTLSQLAHPRIVRVFDFGVDAIGPYYSMELLHGGDLQELAPLPWRRACAITRDVCSALSLLHSRRFVHRDLSPRNVRCAPNGDAKLIDFGAMAPVGPTKLLVGTPPCCAPESVQLQSLDGRTDLFSLGATLYFMLVGRHAYPARQFSMLASLWREGFPRPSELVADIPPALDALVLDLLRLAPDARPASAAEVMERLSAIDGVAPDEQLRVANAYLATPSLVGRDAALARVRRRVERATGGRSRSVVIEGAPGVGRTRFLDACVLDATLAGQVVVRADSDDAVSGDYGVVRVLARQLLERMPQQARDAAAPMLDSLLWLLPELDTAPQPANDVIVPRGQLQRALHAWLTGLSKLRPFVLAVDDFHRIDEPSAALIALLERDSTEHELCLLITVESGTTWTAESARKLLQPLTTLQLAALSSEETHELLTSVWGSVPHIQVLAHRLCELSNGSPRDLLRLAQHLVDRGVVRYAAGAWTLPAEIDPTDLPASLSDALAERIAALPEVARELACAFALCPDQGFSFAECEELGGQLDAAQCLAQVRALIGADIVRRIGEGVTLSRRAWVPLLRATLSGEREPVLERRLAETFERRQGQEFRAAQHWFRAGESRRAVELLVQHAAASSEATARGPEIFQRYLLSLPSDWFETFSRGVQSCEELDCPRRYRHAILSRVVGIVSFDNAHAAELFDKLFAELRQDSGYDDWHALPADMDPQQRLMKAVAQAKARYDGLPERDRVLDPVTAIRGLTRAVVSAAGPIAMTLDVKALRELPQLELFARLAPALDASHKLVEGVIARCTGRVPHARRVYGELLAMLERPDRSGFDESHAAYVRLGVMNGLGMVDAGHGLRSSLDWAEKIAVSPAYEVNAALIRMLYCSFQGDVAGAEEQKRLADRLRIQNSGRQMHEGGHLLWEVQAHAMCGDLTRVRHASEDIASLAKRFPEWVCVLRYATAEYYRLTRDFERARLELEQALEGRPVGSHQIWPYAAQAHVLVLLELGQTEKAARLAMEYVEQSQRELEYVPTSLALARALACAAHGDSGAGANVEALIRELEAAGIAGVHLGIAHETRARIALLQHDMATFARHVEACGKSYLAHRNGALTAKHHRLVQEARRSRATQHERSNVTPDSVAQYGGTRIELALAGCRDDDQRARLALTLLTAQSGAQGGFLYLLEGDGIRCAAHVGSVAQSPELTRQVQDFLEAKREEAEQTSTESGTDDELVTQWSVGSARQIRPLLLCHTEKGQLVVTGVAALVLPDTGNFVQPVQTSTAVSQFFASKGVTSLMLLAD